MTLIKSISGIRGLIDSSLNIDLIVRYVQAFSNLSPLGKILLARDTRNSGSKYINHSIDLLNRTGRETINSDIIPTPTAQFVIIKNKYAGGIVFTASHNPSDWNGMKFINSNGTFLDHEQFKKLEEEFNNCPTISTTIDSDLIIEENDSLKSIDSHINNVLNLNIINKEMIKDRKHKVVVDCVNGATSVALPKLLENLGCDVIKINSDYNENFGRSPEPIPKNLSQLSAAVINNNADIGFATDPDGDRLSIVDNQGNPLGEETTLGLCVFYILKYFKEYRKHPIVTNLSTSLVSEQISKKFNTPFIRTAVGEINVVKRMEKEGSLLGGEGNGGVILKDSHLGRDSLVGAAIVLNLLAIETIKINELFDALPKYYIHKSSVALKPKNENFENKIKEYFIEDEINESDGLKIIRQNEWIHIRKSNTEPILRIISESESVARSKELVEIIKNEIK